MRFHFSSVSILALATGAALALPFGNASAEDFAIRNGRKVAASLEAPVEAAAPQALAANPHVQVNNGETITNNEELISGTVNNGKLINNGKITYFDVGKNGEAVSNQNGDVGRLRNFGTALNTGKIYNAQNRDGTFTNGNGGIVSNLTGFGGTVTNQGSMTDVDLLGGTLNNENAATVKQVNISKQVFNSGSGNYDETAATLNNNGRIEGANVSRLGTLNNNQGGSVNTLTNAGKVVNKGSIYSAENLAGGTLLNESGGSIKTFTNFGTAVNDGSMYIVQQKDGSFTNGETGTIYGLTQTGGTTTNNGKIANVGVQSGTFTNNASGTLQNSTSVSGGILTNAGAIIDVQVGLNGALTNNQTGTINRVTSSGTTANSGTIGNVKLEGGILTNAATGVIDNLVQAGGTATNSGNINFTTIQSGTLTNNGLGTIGEATLSAGILLNSGKIETLTVDKDGNVTNNQSGVITTLSNAGTVTNAGQIGTVTQTAGELTNNGTILGQALIDGGTLTNNKSMGTATIAVGATLVNNKSGIVRSVTNSGLVSNDGAIQYVEQTAGALINGVDGTISGLQQNGGTATNNGTINQTIITAGTLSNNAGATLGEAAVNGGQLENSGTITALGVGKDGVFANNKTGKAGVVTSAGKSSNGGEIVNLFVTGGEFNNSATITENVNVAGGRFISTGLIGGALNNQGTSDLSGTINGGVNNGANGKINLRGDLTGKGNFINSGTVGAFAATDISGFDTFANAGSLLIKGDMDISGDVISSGKIGMAGDLTQFETLSAGGDFTLTSTAQTSINIAADGKHDTISAGGDLTLGGTLNVAATGNTYALKSLYETFTSTAGDVVGRFTNVIVTGTKDLFGAAETTATGVVLAIRNRALLNKQLETLELGENGNILTGLNYQGTEGAELFDTLATIKAGEAPGLIAQITGAASSTVVNVGNSAAQGFGNLMQKVATASGLRRSNDGVLAYEKARKAEEGKFEPVLRQGQGAVGFWARGFGETGSSNGGGDAMIGGIGAGADIALGESLTIGASAGYSMARFGNKTALTGNTNSFHAGGYVAMGATAPEATGFGLTASGSYSKHDTKQERTITIGSMTSVASANYGGTTIAGEVMVRNGFTIGDKVPLTIAPIAGLKFAMDNDEGYAETGAGGLNLTVSGAKRRSLVGVVGLQLASRIETESVVFIPHISGVYQHEFLDTSSTTTRTLSGSSTPFTVKQGGDSRSSVAVEAGLGMRFAGGLAVDVSGYGVFSADEKRYGATATLKAGF